MIDRDKVRANLAEWLENPSWAEYYGGAPSERCREFIALEFYYSETNGWFYDWEHYDLLQGLHLLRAVREGIPYADQAEELYGKDSDRVLSEQAALLSEELQLLYFDKQARNKEDIETIRGLSSEAIADLEARFAFTEDEQKSIQETINKNYGYISIRECEDFLKKRRDS